VKYLRFKIDPKYQVYMFSILFADIDEVFTSKAIIQLVVN